MFIFTNSLIKQSVIGGSSAVSASSSSAASSSHSQIIVDKQYKPGHLQFVRSAYKSRATREKEAREKANSNGGGGGGGGVKPFAGKGNTIR